MTDKEIKYRRISYEEFGRMMDQLEALLRQTEFPFTHILSPPRGGWPIGVHLSHRFEVPLLGCFQEVFRELQTCPRTSGGMGVLFADDIVDSGKTLLDFYASAYPVGGNVPWFRYGSCCLFQKPRARVKAGLYLWEVENDVWVVFPWEKPEARKDRQTYLQKGDRI